MADSTQIFLTTRELAELLRIKERKVYDLAASGVVPCNRATGKLLFPRAEVEAWLHETASHPPVEPGERPPNVFLGSHDPLLDWALKESRAEIASFFDGSLDGLERFANGEGIACGLHVYDCRTQSWNTHRITADFARRPVVAIEWAWRERGLIISPTLENEPSGLADLAGLRFAPRQSKAGSQHLFEQLLVQEGGVIADLRSIPAQRSETDAALAVSEGKADAAFGLSCVARQFGLAFRPVIRERFDLLVDRRAWFEPGLQRLDAFCRGPAFARRANELGGYDISGYGSVHFNG